MNLGGVRLGTLSPAARDSLLAEARAAAPSYDHVGSTLDPQRWSAPGVHAHRLDVGAGPRAFDAARHALRTWVPHAAIGARVEPAGQRVETDATVLLVLRRGPLYVAAPDRIIGVADGPRRFAFAYGTLPGHPERGEESFTVDHLDDGTVRVTIRVQAGPATRLARAFAPVVHRLQAAAAERYLRAIAAHVATATGTRPPGRRAP